MKNVKKIIFFSVIFLHPFFWGFSQEYDYFFDEDSQSIEGENSGEEDYILDDFGMEVFEDDVPDSYDDDYDFFDDLFNDSEDVDDAVISEPSNDAGKISETELFKTLSLTGSLSSDFGGFLNYDVQKNDWDGGGVFLISNTLYLSAQASKDLKLNGSFTTSLSNKFSIELNTLYFDYLIKDLIFVTAGKRSFSWGYPILFTSGEIFGSGTNSYGLPHVGPAYTNVLEISSNHAVFQVKVPWSFGTFTGMVMYDFDKLSGNVSWKYLSYATSLEITVLNQAINLFARTYAYEETEKEVEIITDDPDSTSATTVSSESSEIETEVAKFGYWMHPVVGLETKRTVLGTDFYAQGQFRLLEFDIPYMKNIDYAIATGGFYKLFDSFDPNIGIALEYQYVFDPNLKKENAIHNHKIAAEFGLRRMGKDKNLKLGIDWGHNFSTENGLFAVAFYISNIFHHGQWKNIIGMSYGKNLETPKLMYGSIISINMSY